MSTVQNRAPFEIGGLVVQPGKKASGELPISRLVTGTQISLPLQVFHGTRPGPVMWLSSAVHGDEIAGIEIIRRITGALHPKSMGGTLITVPVVNVHGFLNSDRYLPDRRDLNRSFPGSAKGSMAARIAHLFMTEIVNRSDMGIDFHTGSDHRANIPQIRADLDDDETRRLAEVFGAPISIHARVRDGSLRAAATEAGCKVLLYEGGEAWRFDREPIEAGVRGVQRILADQHMTEDLDENSPPVTTMSRKTTWIRARRSGLVLLSANLGEMVVKGQVLGVIHDSVGERLSRVRSSTNGIIIGQVQHPLVNQGDAMIHIAEVLE